MFDFEKMVTSMRGNGVRRLELVFFDSCGKIKPNENERKAQVAALGNCLCIDGLNSVVVEFFPPQPPPPGMLIDLKPPSPPIPPLQPTTEPEKHDDRVDALSYAAEAAKPAAEEAAVKDTAPEPKDLPKPQGPEKKAEPVAEPEKPAEAAAKPKRERKERKPGAETETKAPEQPAAAMAKPDKVYDVFVETVEQDDGTKADVKRGLIAQMTLDDMLRVNATFCLGLDTDVATEALRAELTTCFI